MSEENSRRPHHVEDLSVLSRRGALSAAEQRAFADALGASATLAAAHQLGLDFDQIAVVRPGDDTLIAQVATRSVSRSSSRAGGGWRLRGLLLVAALALASSAIAWWQRGRSATAVGSPTVTLAGPSAALEHTRRTHHQLREHPTHHEHARRRARRAHVRQRRDAVS